MKLKTAISKPGRRALNTGLLLASAALSAWVTTVVCQRSALVNLWDDWLSSNFSPHRSGSEIFLIDIDESSLAQHGRWPWPRAQLAELISLLLDKHRAAVVGVDIILSEKGQGEGNGLLGALDPERVVWAHAVSMAGEPAVDQGVIVAAPACPTDSPWSYPVNGWLGLTPEIAGDYFRAGHIRPWPESDQVVRTYQPFLAHGDSCVPGLGLAMYGALMGLPPDAPLHSSGGNWTWGGIPLGLESSGLLRLLWNADRIKAIPARKVLSGEAALPDNAAMIVGSTAVGIGDFVTTPRAERFAGVGVHALAFGQWLDRAFIAKPAYHDLLVMAFLIPVFLTFWITSRNATIRPWLFGIGLFAAWNLIAIVLMHRSIVLETEAMLWAFLWLPAIQGLRLWQEKKASKLIYEQFHAYLPEKVLQELIDSKVDPRTLQAESRDVTVLFADLRGFTSLSENMEPQQVVALLNEVMEYLSSYIAERDGTLDKFMGDCVMAFWGAPVSMEDHADRGVACAIAILDNLGVLNERLEAKGLPPVRLGIGINSGSVAVGNMGSVSRKNYSAVGDAVNTASRLQQLCKVLRCSLLIGADTASACKEQELKQLQVMEVRGKKRRVTVFASAKYLPDAPSVKQIIKRARRPDEAADG